MTSQANKTGTAT